MSVRTEHIRRTTAKIVQRSKDADCLIPVGGWGPVISELAGLVYQLADEVDALRAGTVERY